MPSSSLFFNQKVFPLRMIQLFAIFVKKRGKCVESMLSASELRSSSTRERSLLLFSIRSRGHSLNVWLMVVLEHKLVVKVEPATSKICIHYKLGVGLAYVQGEAYDGLEVLTTPLGSGGRLAQGVAQGTPTPRPDPSFFQRSTSDILSPTKLFPLKPALFSSAAPSWCTLASLRNVR